ncbi:hypothetical protein [Cohnella sp. GCM10027633]|uniref:hypothetical protein n=1 Tax=unclassified Cohnella TaxID=2636738 RepID=UPI00362C099E
MSESNREEQGRPEWYERLRADEEFPGRTFTADAMDRIERRALSGEAGRSAMWLRWSGIGGGIVVAGLAVWLTLAGPLSGNGKPEGQAAEVRGPLVGDYWPIESPELPIHSGPLPLPSPSPESQSSSSPSQEVQTVYFLKGPVLALPESQPYATFAVFEGNGTDTYTVADRAAEHAKIVDANGNAGWIPAWYLVDEGDTGERVETVAESYPMIVDKPVTYRLYPDEPTPSGFELWAGKVVNVIRTFGDDWLEIQVVTYDSPYMENKWVRKDELIPYEDGKAKEGLVYPSRQTVTLYNVNGEAQQELPPLTTVYIEGEQGDRYRVTAGGGVGGYMNKEDFLPNPFSMKVIDQSNIEELGL